MLSANEQEYTLHFLSQEAFKSAKSQIVQRQQQRGEPSEREHYSLAVEDTLQDSA